MPGDGSGEESLHVRLECRARSVARNAFLHIQARQHSPSLKQGTTNPPVQGQALPTSWATELLSPRPVRRGHVRSIH